MRNLTKLSCLSTSALFFLVMTLSSAQAQDQTSEWQGEWGAFQHIPASNGRIDRYPGAGLSIKDCKEAKCNFSLIVEEKDGAHGDAKGILQIESENAAFAHIEAYSFKCSLSMTKTTSQPPAISIKEIDPGCSNFLTTGASFAHSLPLRSRANFYGDEPQLCYLADGPARAALCGNELLAQQEHDWTMLVYKTSDLSPAPINPQQEEKKLLQGCNAASNTADCLTAAFRDSTNAMNAGNAAWLETVTAPGNPEEAAPKIVALAGSYRHTFTNGDVGGDHFQSTDTLTITKLSDSSLRYSLHLEFFNGHQCNREGVASYRKAGFFVDQTSLDPDQARAMFPAGSTPPQLCIFEIIPTNGGVEFHDPTGICKMTDCAMRGGYNHASFSFEERVTRAN